MFSFASFFKKEDNYILANELDRLIGKINLIDIREPGEVSSGTIKTATNIPMGNLLNNPGQYLKKDQIYYLICQSGMRSGRTASALKKVGYNVVNVKGGYGSYSGKNRK